MTPVSMETQVTGAIISRFFAKLQDHVAVDVAVVGAGPSGLVAAHDLARAGFKVAVFESKLAPGGGVWGGGMLFNEVAVQEDVLPILADFGVRSRPAGAGCHTCDAVELAAGLVFGACRAGAVVFNTMKVEDVMVRENSVSGLVVNWTPVVRLEMHVDPLVIAARAVLDGTGHPSEVAALASRKAGLRLDSPDGGIAGERSMWMALGEESTVTHTKRLCPGLYASGMAANNVQGGFRMGPIFGGMLKSGRRAAGLIAADLAA